MALPDPFSATEFFDADPKVTAQVINGHGTVWTVDFEDGVGGCTIKKNECDTDPNCKFKAQCKTP
jgi:hypothetical protein